jgi:ferric-dicitrate binding protein FerR (iron transport regulator)
MKESNGYGQGYSEEQAQRTAWLIAGYLQQTLTEEEHDELDQWVTASDENQRLFEELINPAAIQKGLTELGGADSRAALKKIKARLQFDPKKTKANKRRLLPYGIAASLILLAGLYFIYNLMNGKTKTKKPLTEINTIRPGGNYAILKLANGQTINLQDSKNGLIDSTSGSEVLKTADGQLSYVNSGLASIEQHTLTTPVGGQYNVLLPDGSRVWLNAMSSLKYPVSFTDKERVVELTGEAYFEVATQVQAGSANGMNGGKIPFIVNTRGMRVEVLGTHFNINAYEDEPTINTTLLEGKVKIAGSELKPGEQAQLDSKGKIDIKENVNTEEIIAWKNGLFQFRSAPIESIMRQVSRWYDAEIVYKGKVDFHFTATIHRHEPVSKLLQVLEEMNNVHFIIEGKKIIVKPETN